MGGISNMQQMQVEWIDNDSYVYTKTDHTGRPSLVYYVGLQREANGNNHSPPLLLL